MNFHIIISSLATLTFLAVQVHAAYNAEQLESAKAGFVTYYEHLNGILQENGKNPVSYSPRVTSGEEFDTWSTNILNEFKTALKKIPSDKRASYKDNILGATGTLYNALVNCNVNIFGTSTKTLIENIEEKLGSPNKPFGSSSGGGRIQRLFSRATGNNR